MTLLGTACTAGVNRPAQGSGGNGGGIVITGSAGTTGSGGSVVITGSGGQAGTTTQPPDPDAGACQQFEVKFEPKIPTVDLLVDRSTSMYPCLDSTDMTTICADHTNTSWDRLRMSLLDVVMQLQADVRFGFYTFTGTNASHGNMCPTITKVLPALNNHGPISTSYNGLPWPTNTDKWETPTAQSLTMVGAELAADPMASAGDRYIMLVTDGAPDYCDDPNSLCPPDAVVGKLQALKANGITTIVFGLQSKVNDLPMNTLQAFANAGAGETTVAPTRTGLDVNAFWDQCNGYPNWQMDLVAKFPECAMSANFNQCRGRTIGTYGTTMGPARAYVPNAGDQAQLVAQLAKALAGVKSCTFDLGGHISVALNLLNRASVFVQGNAIALDPTNMNGWNMTSPTQLQLYGAACDMWRDPKVTDIKFNFPCEIIID